MSDTTATTTDTTAVAKVKKIDVARAKFAANLDLALNGEGKRFRKIILAELSTELEITVNAAASMYNVVKKEFEADGRLPSGKIGRTPKADAGEVAATEETASVEEGNAPADTSEPAVEPVADTAVAPAQEALDWVLTSVATGEVRTYGSRNKARAAKAELEGEWNGPTRVAAQG